MTGNKIKIFFRKGQSVSVCQLECKDVYINSLLRKRHISIPADFALQLCRRILLFVAMNGWILLAGISAMTIAIHDVTGFQCYTCGPSTDCTDAFGATTSCGNNVNTCKKVQVSGFNNKQKVTTRACGVEGLSADGCGTEDDFGVYTAICFCDSSLCNLANRYGSNMLFGAVMAFAVIKFA